jgi:hypothetical protein
MAEAAATIDRCASTQSTPTIDGNGGVINENRETPTSMSNGRRCSTTACVESPQDPTSTTMNDEKVGFDEMKCKLCYK